MVVLSINPLVHQLTITLHICTTLKVDPHLHVSNLILLPLVLLPLRLHQLKSGLHKGVVIPAIKLQLSINKHYDSIHIGTFSFLNMLSRAEKVNTVPDSLKKKGKGFKRKLIGVKSGTYQ